MSSLAYLHLLFMHPDNIAISFPTSSEVRIKHNGEINMNTVTASKKYPSFWVASPHVSPITLIVYTFHQPSTWNCHMLNSDKASNSSSKMTSFCKISGPVLEAPVVTTTSWRRVQEFSREQILRNSYPTGINPREFKNKKYFLFSCRTEGCRTAKILCGWSYGDTTQ